MAMPIPLTPYNQHSTCYLLHIYWKRGFELPAVWRIYIISVIMDSFFSGSRVLKVKTPKNYSKKA
ncbi:hypothetical protein ACHAXS_010057 [Conticribra weissflogii]